MFLYTSAHSIGSVLHDISAYQEPDMRKEMLHDGIEQAGSCSSNTSLYDGDEGLAGTSHEGSRVALWLLCSVRGRQRALNLGGRGWRGEGAEEG